MEPQVPQFPMWTATHPGTSTSSKRPSPYYSFMWTKQHQAFCSKCGKETKHVTHYQKDDVGGSLVADVQCAEHKESSVYSNQRMSATPETAA